MSVTNLANGAQLVIADNGNFVLSYNGGAITGVSEGDYFESDSNVNGGLLDNSGAWEVWGEGIEDKLVFNSEDEMWAGLAERLLGK